MDKTSCAAEHSGADRSYYCCISLALLAELSTGGYSLLSASRQTFNNILPRILCVRALCCSKYCCILCLIASSAHLRRAGLLLIDKNTETWTSNDSPGSADSMVVSSVGTLMSTKTHRRNRVSARVLTTKTISKVRLDGKWLFVTFSNLQLRTNATSVAWALNCEKTLTCTFLHFSNSRREKML